MADLRGFDANQIDPASDFDPIPAGKYVAAIIASEMKPTKAGTGQCRFDICQADLQPSITQR